MSNENGVFLLCLPCFYYFYLDNKQALQSIWVIAGERPTALKSLTLMISLPKGQEEHQTSVHTVFHVIYHVHLHIPVKLLQQEHNCLLSWLIVLSHTGPVSSGNSTATFGFLNSDRILNAVKWTDIIPKGGGVLLFTLKLLSLPGDQAGGHFI